jgi:hypothetical protein
MPSAFNVGSSPITTNGTLAVTGAGTTAQYVRGDGSLATFPGLTGFVPYTGATADVNLGTHDLTAERGTFENNGSSDTLTVNHTSGSGKGINVSKGGNGEALLVTKTSGSGNAMAVVGGRTALVDLSLSSVSNATGNFLTISGGVVHQRTPSETRSDVGAQAQLNGTGFVKASGTTITYDNSTYQVTSEKAQPNGYASLDSNGKVPLVQINDALIGNVNFQGLWNAATNTPTLANPPASGTKGYYYIVSTAGTFAGISFEVGDWIISNGTAWGKVDNTDAVSSVFGRTGNVTASNGDYNTSQVTENTNLYYTEARVNANTNVAANTAARHNAVTVGTANGLSLNVQQLSLQLATSGQNGALSSTDWSTFNNKENAITAGTTAQYFRGDKTFQTLNTGVVPESGNLYFTNARAIASVLTGYSSGAGTISAADSILSAIQKLNGNIGALVTGVSSVNGQTGVVVLTTTNIAEGTNLYYTEARVNANTNVAANTAARHASVTLGTANGLSLSTQQLSLGLASAGVTGALSGTDWSTFNSKQNALTNPVTGTGTNNYLPKFTGSTTIGNSQIFDNGTNVGVGTALPNRPLDVLGSIRTQAGTIDFSNSFDNQIWFASGVFNFKISGSDRMYLNSLGNLGLGVTPSAWDLGRTLQIGSAFGTINYSGTSAILGIVNAFYNGSSYVRQNTGSVFSLEYNISVGNALAWRMGEDSSSGTTTTLSPVMALFNNGNLFVGTSPSDSGFKLDVNGTGRFVGNLTASSFIRSGGTSSQFLKADGSVDSNSYYLASNPSAFIALTALSGTAPIQYNNTTGAISITQASGSTNGFLSSTDWNTFNNKTSNVGTVTSVAALTLGTSGTDLSSSVANGTTTPVITLNVPTASAANRGALSAADWTTFNGKENAVTAGTTAQYYRGDKTFQTLNTAAVPELTNLYYTEARVNANANVAANTAARHNAVTLGTANGLSLSTQQLSLGLASSSANGALSSTDWTTFNNKQNALTNPVTGTGTAGQVAYWSSGSAITGESNLFWDATNDRLGIATAGPSTRLALGDYLGNRLPYINGIGNTFNAQGITVTSNNSGNSDIGGGLDLTNNIYSVGAISPVISFSSRSLNGNFNNNYAAIYGIFAGDGGEANWSSGHLVFSTTESYGAKERVRITNVGNLLVGTTTDAGFKLDVNGTGRFSSTLRIDGSAYPFLRINGNSTTGSGGGIQMFGNTTQYAEIYGEDESTNNGKILFRTRRAGTITDAFRLTSSGNGILAGNLGVGTELSGWSLGRVLQIGGNNSAINFSGTSAILSIINTFFNGSSYVRQNTGASASFEYGLARANSFNWRMSGEDSSGTTASLPIVMSLSTNGNLSINNTNDTFRLDVNGTGRFTSFINANSAATAANGSINIDNSDPTLRFRRAGGTANKSIYEWRAIAAGGDNDRMELRLWNDAESSASHLISITSAGNMLIGTTTDAGRKLNVNGEIRTISGVIDFGNGNTSQVWGGDSGMNIKVNGAERLTIDSTGAATFTSSVTANTFIVNTSGQARTITTFYASGSLGDNIWIGGGGLNSTTGGGASSLGSLNTSLGVLALQNNTTGYRNTSLGYSSLRDNTTGYSNTSVGEFSLWKNTTGYINSAFGSSALNSNTSGYANSALGTNSLGYITTGRENVAVGFWAGFLINSGGNNTTSSNSTYLGQDTRASADGNTNEVVIGSGARGQGSNSVVIGNGSITKTILRGDVLIGTETPATGAMLNVNGSIRTAAPTGTSTENWRLGRALLATSSDPEDRWIRVQLGTKIYDILAIDRGDA